MSNPTSNFGWVMPTNTDLVTDLPADFAVFGQGVDTTMADLKGGTTGQILSKATSTDMDFVWIANDQGDITAVNVTSPITGGGSAGAVTVGIQSASTSQSGAVQLSDSTSTTSSVLASTPTATKASYDLANTANTTANAAVAKSTVTAKGSIFTATASATPAQLAVGNNGETLVADSSTSTGLRYQTGVNVNQIINGGFDFFQRGTSSSTTGFTCADRWYNLASGTTTFSQDTSVPTAQGVQYSYKWTTGAASSFGQYYTAFESATVKPLRGQAMVFSFWVKTTGTAFTGTLQADAAYSTSSDAYASQTVAVSITGASGITPTSTWTKYSGTLTIPSDASGFKIGLIPTVAQASGVVVYLAAVQLELGSVATTFKRAGGTIQGELAACQRYYFRNAATNNSASFFMSTFNTSTTGWYGVYTLPVTMRTKPTVETSGTASHYRIYSAAGFTTLSTVPTLDQANESTVSLSSSVASGLTAGQGSVLAANGTSSAYLGFTAEL